MSVAADIAPFLNVAGQSGTRVKDTTQYGRGVALHRYVTKTFMYIDSRFGQRQSVASAGIAHLFGPYNPTPCPSRAASRFPLSVYP